MKTRSQVFPAEYELLDEIREFVGTAAVDAGMSEKQVYAVQLAVDEACTNIIEHAYAGREGSQIQCTVHESQDALTIILQDSGRTFDPTAVEEPDIDAEMEDRKIGGLGIFLMRNMMDEVIYQHSPDAGNTLTMVKNKRTAE